MLDIPDIFLGWTVDAWPEPTYEEKMRVPPPPPPGAMTLAVDLGRKATKQNSECYKIRYYLKSQRF